MKRDITEHKRSEELLQESVSLLTSTLESTADGILVVDLNRKIVMFNEKFLELWRIPEHVIEPRDDAQATEFVKEQLKHPQQFVEKIEQLYQRPTTSSLDVIEFKDGRVYERYCQPQTLDGNPVGRVWSFRDVTERKRAEESLKESEERYRAIFEEDLAANSITTPHGRLLDCNSSFWRMFGFSSKAEALAYDLNSLFRSKAERDEIVDMIRKGRIVEALEIHMRRVDGTPLNVVTNGIGIFDDKDELIEIHGHGFDITERRRAEEAVRTSEAELRAVFAAMSDVILVLDREGRYLKIAPTNPALLYKPPAELVGKTLHEIFPPAQADFFLNGVRDALLKCEPINMEYSLTINGKEFWFIGTVSPMSEESAIYVARDVTKRKRAEDALRDSEERLRQSQKIEAVGQLAGGIAHDFNNLLTAILGYSDLLLRQFKPDDPSREKVEEIKRAGERAASLTRQLLAFSRKQILQPKVLNLNSVVADVDKLLQRLIGAHIAVTMRLEPALWSIKADPGQIEQVILNLAINARDAMPEGGHLIIETRNIPLDDAYVSSHVAVIPGEYVMLTISDTGTGMDAEVQARAFEPFFTMKEQGKGTGLGLSTVYGIVKQSGGNVWLYSEVGIGTTFKIYLPRVDENLESLSAESSRLSITSGTETVLLVEDEEGVRNLTRQILEMNGYHVLEASHGEEGLAVANQYKGNIHLLVTDVIMPRLSGRRLAETLVATRPDIKVLFMSGYTEESIVHSGIMNIATSFLQKPFAPDALTQTVRELLDAPTPNPS